MITLLILIIIYLSFISLGLPDSLLGSAWPSMSPLLNVPLHYAGFISMIIAGGTVVSSILSEKIIRRFGTGVVTAVSVLMTAAALIGFSFSRVFWPLFLCAIPLGLGAGSVDAALNNYVALHYKARHMSWLHCFWGIGASLGPIIMSAFLIHKNSWNLGYRTIGIIQFCLVAVLFASLPLWKKNNAQKTATQQHNSIKLKQLLHIVGVKHILAAFFCYCAIETVTGLWGSSYLVMAKNISPKIAAQWIALYYIGITSGRFISGFVTMKLNNRQMIRLGQIITGGGIIVLLLPFGNSTLLPGLFMIGLGCAPIFPSLLHETPNNFGGEFSQAIMGIQMASAYIGTTLMPPIFGWFASHIGFNIFPIFIGIILIIKIIMVETLNRKIDNKNRK
ncbi:MAG: MFS transporter [Spirochaetaceae bacterium]|jgi:fucose permease|nr:MFS transporter [Spirochaetaceae bacterium]